MARPDGIAGARHTDHLFSRNIGGNERAAYGPPGEGLAGQEVRLCGVVFFLKGEVDPKTNHGQDVNGKDGKIGSRKIHMALN
jgi:hypothetical protein